jgi:hypothetical protein
MFPESRSGAILIVLSAVLAIVIGLFVILAGVASYKVSRVERRWAESWGTQEEILQRYPATDADADALELERLTAPLGIDTATRSAEGRTRPDKDKATANAEFRHHLGPWSSAQLERGRRAIDPPPAEVLAYLQSHEPQLEAIRKHLTRGVVPRWEMHLEDGVEAPIRNLLGHINLQKFLVGDALVKAYLGDNVTAQRDLEAGWTLLQSLRGDPFLISQLIAVADARLITGALRPMEISPAIWRERMFEHDFRESFTNALKYEGWYWTRIEDASAYAGLSGVAQRVMINVAKPYFKLCMADVSDVYRERLENLDEVTAICDYDLSSRQADLEIPIPRWNVLGGLVVPNLGSALDRLARLEVDLELTARLLDLEQRRLDDEGSWPDSLPDGERSIACPKDRWIYDITDDGTMTLALARELTWSELRGHKLPTEFTIE